MNRLEFLKWRSSRPWAISYFHGEPFPGPREASGIAYRQCVARYCSPSHENRFLPCCARRDSPRRMHAFGPGCDHGRNGQAALIEIELVREEAAIFYVAIPGASFRLICAYDTECREDTRRSKSENTVDRFRLQWTDSADTS